MAAASAVIDRAYGKATAHVISEDLSADVAKWTDDQIDSALRQLTANMWDENGATIISFADGTKYKADDAPAILKKLPK